MGIFVQLSQQQFALFAALHYYLTLKCRKKSLLIPAPMSGLLLPLFG
jgi:hypothetical protein